MRANIRIRELVCLSVLLVWVDQTLSSPSLKIDNGLIEPPKLECLSDSILVHIRTKQPFFGRLFVKGQSHLPECSIRGNGPAEAPSNQKTLHLLFENCFLRRQRVFSPHRQIIVTTIVVVSFHPFFLTESDGAYRMQCVYLDGKQSLSAVLNVHGGLTTTPQPGLSPLPTCKYEILEGGPNGRPVPLASVGSRVYHKWHCQAAEPQKYCALIHSCIAEDGNGSNVQILDEQGCTRDSVLLQNLEYLDDLTAGQQATVYKFADRESIFFKCEIMVTHKQENQVCQRPVCQSTNIGNGMAHFENPPRNASTSVTFDRRVLAMRRAFRRRIRDTLNMDVLAELDVLEAPIVEEPETSDGAVDLKSRNIVIFVLLFWSFVFNRF